MIEATGGLVGLMRPPDGAFIGYTVYDTTTSDLPGQYVVRAWVVHVGGGWPFVLSAVFSEGIVWHAYVGCCYPTLSAARADLHAAGLILLWRDAEDDSVIIETWV